MHAIKHPESRRRDRVPGGSKTLRSLGRQVATLRRRAEPDPHRIELNASPSEYVLRPYATVRGFHR